jgi:hypothetical protein
MCDESTNTCNLFLLFDEQTSGGDRVITDQTEGVFGCFSGCCSHFPSFFSPSFSFPKPPKRLLKVHFVVSLPLLLSSSS